MTLPGSTPALRTRDEATRRLGSDRHPVVLRLPFSHYCRKAEWGLTRAAVPYTTIDVGLRHMRDVRRANPTEKTVPVLATAEGLVHGSHAILRWADANRAADRPSLYPEAHRTEILAWEAWVDRDLGAPVRREAYRVLASRPQTYARKPMQRVRWQLARPLFRRVHRYLDRNADPAEDRSVLDDAAHHIIDQLRRADSGYLFTQQPTGADIATAALLEPLLPIAPIRGYDQIAGWGEFVQFVRTVRPGRTTRESKRKIQEADWQAFETLNAAQTKLERPTADQTAP